MPSRILIALLCAGALAFACGPRTHSEAASTASLATAAPVTQQGSALRTAKKANTVSSVFDVRVQPDGVEFALRITNDAKKHIELSFPSGQTHDFVVVDSLGREVWRWGATRMFTQGVQNKLLSGGESMRIAEEWEKPPVHGKYVAVASLHSSNFPVEERVEFVLP
jgi:hypothetical protein